MSNGDEMVKQSNAISRAVGELELMCSRLLMLASLCAAASVLLTPEIHWISWVDPRLQITEHHWVVAGAALAFIAEVGSFCLIARPARDGSSRYMLALAQIHGNVPIVLRPIFFLWWASHFFLFALVGHFAVLRISLFENPDSYQRWVTNIVRFLFAVGVSFSTNAYLMLMTGSVTQRKLILNTVFRLRIIADALLCADLLLPHLWF